jgi:tRNA nucleotidyltransferase (CCA-adding enzyme)
LNNNGFEAYIVGGYVRDYIMGNESTDVDICTNALPKDIMKYF